MVEGFWIVVLARKDGSHDLCYDYVHGDYTAEFKSEVDATVFMNECKNMFPDETYYWKYVPWGEFA